MENVGVWGYFPREHRRTIDSQSTIEKAGKKLCCVFHVADSNRAAPERVI